MDKASDMLKGWTRADMATLPMGDDYTFDILYGLPYDIPAKPHHPVNVGNLLIIVGASAALAGAGAFLALRVRKERRAKKEWQAKNP